METKIAYLVQSQVKHNPNATWHWSLRTEVTLEEALEHIKNYDNGDWTFRLIKVTKSYEIVDSQKGTVYDEGVAG